MPVRADGRGPYRGLKKPVSSAADGASKMPQTRDGLTLGLRSDKAGGELSGLGAGAEILGQG